MPYGRQIIDDEDIAAVVSTLCSSFLTTGPAVSTFEKAVCAYTGGKHGIAVTNGTAALHCAMRALNIMPGDEVIVPPITFVATANAVLYCGGTPVFADVDPNTLLIDPKAVEAAISPRTKAIVGVDYAGQPCNWDALQKIAEKLGLPLVSDACHAIGATYKDQKVGTLADLTIFSFHPVKHITSGEGGMIVTNNDSLAEKVRMLRGHGITTTATEREKSGAWHYEMVDLGYNYRITDFQCALGSSQLKKLPHWLEKRRALALLYDEFFTGTHVRPLLLRPEVQHAYHLYVVKVPERNTTFKKMRAANIGANVHYMPVYLHPYYQNLGYAKGLCPAAETAYSEILTLPLWPGMCEKDVKRVAEVLLSE